MTPPLVASAYEIVLPIHVLAVVVAFGYTFAYPILFAVAARDGARSVAFMHRIGYTMDRILGNGGMTVVLAAGIFLASDGHHWSEFFVQWGIAVIVILGGLAGAIMIPTHKRALELATREIEAAGDGEVVLSSQYEAAARRLQTVGSAMSALVVVTIFIMAIKP